MWPEQSLSSIVAFFPSDTVPYLVFDECCVLPPTWNENLLGLEISTAVNLNPAAKQLLLPAGLQ